MNEKFRLVYGDFSLIWRSAFSIKFGSIKKEKKKRSKETVFHSQARRCNETF